MRRLALAILTLLALAAPAAAAKKVALVIGNGAYAEAPLKNPANDARAVAATLRTQGFEVLLKENATKAQMNEIVADFGEKLAEGDTALFFFAGHGMQVQGRNYLLPTDARITSEQRVRLETLDVEAVLDQMAAARARVSMVILDACRNNPFERRFRSVGGGLAQINAPEGTLIAYATAPGKVAADGDGANGLYTQEFLKAMAQPGLKVEEVFKQVRVGVTRASNGAQVPWEASSLTGDFYFRAGDAPVATAAGTAAPPAATIDREVMFWDAIKGSSAPTEIRAYLEAFPAGVFAPLARARLALLESQASAQTAAVPRAPTAPPAPASQVAAAPAARAARAHDGSFTGTTPSGILNPQSAYTFIAIENGTVRVTSGQTTAQTTSNYRCLGIGELAQDLSIPEFDINCTSNSVASVVRFTGKLVGEGRDRAIAAQLTVGNGKTVDVTYK